MNPVFPVPPASSAPIANQRPNDPIVEPNLQPNDQLPLRIRARIKKPRIHVEEPKTKESGLEQRQGISTWK
ncbi:MAG: hypothetical protein LBE98_02650, partial [Puniceicoccales bacterium]|nr:hypothetical protein [Puniceicoccales bacterium]